MSVAVVVGGAARVTLELEGPWTPVGETGAAWVAASDPAARRASAAGLATTVEVTGAACEEPSGRAGAAASEPGFRRARPSGRITVDLMAAAVAAASEPGFRRAGSSGRVTTVELMAAAGAAALAPSLRRVEPLSLVTGASASALPFRRTTSSGLAITVALSAARAEALEPAFRRAATSGLVVAELGAARADASEPTFRRVATSGLVVAEPGAARADASEPTFRRAASSGLATTVAFTTARAEASEPDCGSWTGGTAGSVAAPAESRDFNQAESACSDTGPRLVHCHSARASAHATPSRKRSLAFRAIMRPTSASSAACTDGVTLEGVRYGSLLASIVNAVRWSASP